MNIHSEYDPEQHVIDLQLTESKTHITIDLNTEDAQAIIDSLAETLAYVEVNGVIEE